MTIQINVKCCSNTEDQIFNSDLGGGMRETWNS